MLGGNPFTLPRLICVGGLFGLPPWCSEAGTISLSPDSVDCLVEGRFVLTQHKCLDPPLLVIVPRHGSCLIIFV
jgi:hypothetical protein